MDVARLVAKRMLMAVPTLMGVIILTFILSNLLPGDPALVRLGSSVVEEEALEALRHAMGVDQPIHVQFALYIKRLARFDLGFSWTTGHSVNYDLLQRFPATFELVSISMIVAIIVAIPLAVISATRHGRAVDHLARGFAILGLATPVFWTGLAGILIFSFFLKWLPLPTGRLALMMTPPTKITGMYVLDSILTGNWETLGSAIAHLVLPVCALAYSCIATILRLTRSSMLEVLRQNYIRTARAKGVERARVNWIHALRNSLLATVTGLGLTFGQLLGGAIVVEAVFALPGMGRYAVQAIRNLDYSAIQGFILVTAVVFIVINLLTDIVYVLIDPAIRYGRE